ncbi:MAG: substrate-binding domain-containing protein, partial [Eubacteriales bacterium]|nr:substrate-binding domain-containing protein [Eubacteriales bacterium]
VINPFFAELVINIESLSRKEGYSLLLMNTQDNAEIERESIETLISYRVSAIIVCRSQNRELYKNIRVPVICFENPVVDCKAIINVDNEEGGFLAFQHLFNIGCKSILHIKGPSTFAATEDRYRGFIRGYETLADKEEVKLDVIELKSDFRGNVSESELELIDNYSDYDGVFVFNDIMATALVRVLIRQGIEVPRDMNVIGFDGSHFSQMTAPTLTTVSQNADLIAESCMRAIKYFRSEKNIEDRGQPIVYEVPAELVEGDSTRKKLRQPR